MTLPGPSPAPSGPAAASRTPGLARRRCWSARGTPAVTGRSPGGRGLRVLAQPYKCLPDRFGLAGLQAPGFGAVGDPDFPPDFHPTSIILLIQIIRENGPIR